MSRDTLLLPTLDPRSVATECRQWVEGQLARLSLRVGATVQLAAPRDDTDLELTICELVAYAKNGPPHCDDGGGPADYLQTVAEALWTASHPGVYGHSDLSDLAGEGEAESAIQVVMRAALARDLVARGQPVPVAWLASLGSCSVKRARNLGSAGELAVEAGQVDATEARRWLQIRGVPGLG